MSRLSTWRVLLYERPKVYKDLEIPHTLHGALVFKELTDALKFYADVSFNRGWNIKLFDDYDAGIDWFTKWEVSSIG